MKKKMAVAIPGIIFTLFIAYHLVICFITGIAPLPESEIRGYIIKSVVLSLLLPALIYGYTVYSFYLIEENEKLTAEKERQANEYNKLIIQYKRQIQTLKMQYMDLFKKYEKLVAEMDKMLYRKLSEGSKGMYTAGRTASDAAQDRAEASPKTGNTLVPALASAYTARQKLSDKTKEELYKYLEEL